ncbi:hypothetical protein WR25_00551 [Diploscapter pachys]|uniref:C-type lectin domain-containing protein n=1 Tax=Diploscapter pachys TaxID=2018661 RepID=A0A2A2JK27_9BILA|nr:hypothetical protein WR25_00551 [Diploscapter pachys]
MSSGFSLRKLVSELVGRLQDSQLEVQDPRTGQFYSLCEDSFKEEYAESVCRHQSGKFESSQVVPLNASSHSIACGSKPNGERHCFSYLSTYCNHGIRINCQVKYCNKEFIELPSKCITISTEQFNGYNEAKEACANQQHVISVPHENDRDRLIQLINKDFDSTRLYFTSGFRRGSQWTWEGGQQIEFEVEGSGRCLAIRNGTWIGADCDETGEVICEQGKECIARGRYEGSHNHTQMGLPCMKWNDPSVLFYGNVTSKQAEWNHNFCRVVGSYDQPSCFISPNALQECSVPICPDDPYNHEQKADLASICEPGFFQCGNSLQCVADEFRCDYEFDCKNGKDEENCPEYLLSFELIGAYKLAAKITEIWTFIPQVQACAKRCIESLLVCEAFSYEPRTKNCLLTDSTEMSPILAPRISSQFYKRRFSSKDVQFKLNSMTLQAKKDATWHSVCDDGYSTDFASDICHIAGYGRSPKYSQKSSEIPNTKGWKLNCLRDVACNSTQLHECRPLRCSTCSEEVCSDGLCLARHQMCDGRADCSDRDDEADCDNISFRLVNGSEMSGSVEVFFHSQWQPLCQQHFDANKICSSMRMGHVKFNVSKLQQKNPNYDG